MSSSRYCVFFLVTLLTFGLIGCSSTGYSIKSNLIVPKTVRSPVNIPPELVPYVPRFVEILQRNGFAVSKTQDPRALDLVFEFNGNPFNMRVSAGLWRDGIPVLSASATNSGWGTAIARGAAVNSLADSAAIKFETELSSLIAHMQVVPDAQP
jgi:hypothetical protein